MTLVNAKNAKIIFMECPFEVHFEIGFQSFLKHRFFVFSVEIRFDYSRLPGFQ